MLLLPTTRPVDVSDVSVRVTAAHHHTPPVDVSDVSVRATLLPTTIRLIDVSDASVPTARPVDVSDVSVRVTRVMRPWNTLLMLLSLILLVTVGGRARTRTHRNCSSSTYVPFCVLLPRDHSITDP